MDHHLSKLKRVSVLKALVLLFMGRGDYFSSHMCKDSNEWILGSDSCCDTTNDENCACLRRSGKLQWFMDINVRITSLSVQGLKRRLQLCCRYSRSIRALQPGLSAHFICFALPAPTKSFESGCLATMITSFLPYRLVSAHSHCLLPKCWWGIVLFWYQ